MLSWDYAYAHDDYVPQDQSEWMKRLDGLMHLSQISIPGTHDSMSLGWGGDIVQTQSKSLKNQLISGIRFLDIRLQAYQNYPDLLYAYHGIVYLHASFPGILDIVTEFLEKNPSETILMRIKQENKQDSVFGDLVEKVLTKPKYFKYLYNEYSYNPQLEKMRGKFVILENFNRGFRGIPYNLCFDIQDDYYLRTNWDLYSKWEKVKAQLNNANTRRSSNKKFINYLSGSGGSFPYFVASGHSSPGTNAPLLATGLTEPAFHNYYPDFPRVNWFGVVATIAFLGTDELTKNYIEKNKLLYVGIVVSDFPGQGLINSVINVNFISKYI